MRRLLLRHARDLIARTPLNSVRARFAVEATDEEDRPVMTVPFSDTVTEEDEA